jgi:hypothetical protein
MTPIQSANMLEVSEFTAVRCAAPMMWAVGLKRDARMAVTHLLLHNGW